MTTKDKTTTRRMILSDKIMKLHTLGWLEAEEADWVARCPFSWMQAECLADIALRTATTPSFEDYMQANACRHANEYGDD